MNSKNYSSSISGVLIKENLRKYWILGVFSLIAYLCIVVIPVIVTLKNPVSVNSFINEGNFLAATLSAAYPVIIASVVWMFMFSQSGVALTESLPYSRKQTFISNNIAGLILVLAPVVITSVVFLLIRLAAGPVTMGTGSIEGIVAADIFSPQLILKSMLFYLILNMAVYAITVFIAMISGMIGVHLILTGAALAIGPVVAFLTNVIADYTLYGYTEPAWYSILTYRLSPAVTLFIGPTEAFKAALIYLVVSLVLFVLAYVLFRHRAMERVGDTMVYKYAKSVVKLLAGFTAAILAGVAFYGILGNENLMQLYIGALVGGFVVYLGADMIIQKTVRVKGFWKGFALMLVILVLYLGAFALDVAGYETHVPDASEVESIYLDGISTTDNYYGNAPKCSDAAFIASALAFHQDMTATEGQVGYGIQMTKYTLEDGTVCYREADIPEGVKVKDKEAGDAAFIQVDYHLKNGKVMSRIYNVQSDWVYNNKNARDIINNEEYKKACYEILTWDMKKINFVQAAISPSFGRGNLSCYGTDVFDSDMIAQLATAIQADIRSLTPDQMEWAYTSTNNYYFEVAFTERRTADKLPASYWDVHDYSEIDNDGSISIDRCYYINKYYKNTIALLKEWGYYDSVVPSADNVAYMTATKYTYVEAEEDTESDYIDWKNDASQDTITDKDKIKEVLDNGKNSGRSGNCYYELALYGTEIRSTDDCVYYYYDADQAPEWIKSMF